MSWKLVGAAIFLIGISGLLGGYLFLGSGDVVSTNFDEEELKVEVEVQSESDLDRISIYLPEEQGGEYELNFTEDLNESNMLVQTVDPESSEAPSTMRSKPEWLEVRGKNLAKPNLLEE